MAIGLLDGEIPRLDGSEFTRDAGGTMTRCSTRTRLLHRAQDVAGSDLVPDLGRGRERPPLLPR